VENLRKLVYPGRILALGRDSSGRSNVVVYAITGRSLASRARKLVFDSGAIWTKPTDDDAVKKGNPDLLVYPAIVLGPGIAVSNGKQTAGIDVRFQGSPVEALDRALEKWTYEPDAPNYTPRISGCVLSADRAAISLIRRSENAEALRSFFEFPLVAGRARMIATYSGENRDPLPSFAGEPVEIEMSAPSAEAAAEAIYETLGPGEGRPDFRVAVACVFARAGAMDDYRLHIINRAERSTR